MLRLRATMIKILLISALALLTACGGGGSSGDDDPAPDNNNNSTNTNNDQPVISGFNYVLQQGDFWEYQWDYYKNSWSQSSSSTSTDQGRFRITLGPSVLIQGIEAFELLLSGRSETIHTDFTPRWKYVALSDNKIYGGTSTAALDIIFDAQNGVWLGGGFFASFSDSTLIAASAASINNDYTSESGYAVSRSDSESQCEYFPGVGTICGDSSYNYTERDYFKPEVGPLGYYYYNSFSDCGGGFCSGATWKYNIGLVLSSLQGDSVSYELEQESNNLKSTATNISLQQSIWGDLVEPDSNAANQAIAISTTNESTNNSYACAQLVPVPTQVLADTQTGDAGDNLTITDFYSAGNDLSITAEDWYEISLSSSQFLNIYLDFSGHSDADLDFFVIDLSPVLHIGGSYDDNPADGTPYETTNLSLDSGTYLIIVDAYDTPSGRVNYTLSIDSVNDPQNTITVIDWFSFTLDNPLSSLTIQASGGPSLVLIDDADDSIVGAAIAASQGATTSLSSGALSASTYYLGLGESTNSDLQYQISVTLP